MAWCSEWKDFGLGKGQSASLFLLLETLMLRFEKLQTSQVRTSEPWGVVPVSTFSTTIPGTNGHCLRCSDNPRPPVFVYPKATVWAQAETGVWWHLLRSRDWMLQRQMIEDLFGAPRKWCPCIQPSNPGWYPMSRNSSSLVLLSICFFHLILLIPWSAMVALVVLETETTGAPSVRPRVDPL